MHKLPIVVCCLSNFAACVHILWVVNFYKCLTIESSTISYIDCRSCIDDDVGNKSSPTASTRILTYSTTSFQPDLRAYRDVQPVRHIGIIATSLDTLLLHSRHSPLSGEGNNTIVRARKRASTRTQRRSGRSQYQLPGLYHALSSIELVSVADRPFNQLLRQKTIGSAGTTTIHVTSSGYNNNVVQSRKNPLSHQHDDETNCCAPPK